MVIVVFECFINIIIALLGDVHGYTLEVISSLTL